MNGRLKNVFPFFKHTIEGSYTPKIMRFVRIACAILNKYFPPIFTQDPFHDLVADKVESHTNNNNSLKDEVESLGLRRMTQNWQRATPTSIIDFPRLSWDDLKLITLGTYQLKVAAKYIQEHLTQSSEFGIFLHRQTPQIIRAQIQSRFQKSKKHGVWVKYLSGVNGVTGIEGLYCDCKVGERTLGCCSHLASVSFIFHVLLL